MPENRLAELLKVAGGLALAVPALSACDAICGACCAAAGDCSAYENGATKDGCCAATYGEDHEGCCAAAQ